MLDSLSMIFWTDLLFSDSCVVLPVQGKKIKQKEYLPVGKYPVVDQGAEYIGGYFNDPLLLIEENPPFIVFGDHTKVVKFINFKFIPGADGLKVFKPFTFYNEKMFYYLIKCLQLPDKGYARHYQYLAKSFLPLPPLPEQRRIVARIEELFSDLDKGVESLKAAQARLAVYRQAVLKAAFVGRLTGITCMKTVVLGDLCHNVEYGSAAKSSKAGKVPVLRMGNIQNGRFDWSDLVYTSDDAEIEKYRLKKNDVLFNRTNSPEWVGKTAIYKGEQPALFAGYLIRINYREDLLDPEYLTYYLNSRMAKNHGDKVKSFGVNQSNINGTKLKQYPFPICPLPEQHAIVAAIESRLSVCERQEAAIKEALLRAEALRQSILKKAFEGRLLSEAELAACRAEPDWEPAEQLLARIERSRNERSRDERSREPVIECSRDTVIERSRDERVPRKKSAGKKSAGRKGRVE